MIGNQDNITFPGNLPAVSTLALLRAIPVATLSGDTNVLVQGGSASGDGGGGAYIFKPSSTDLDDGLRVIKPDDVTGLQAGRWKFIGALSAAAGPPGASDNTYTSHTELFASDPARKSARLVGDTDANPLPDGNFNYVDGTGWVPQQADGVGYSRAPGILTYLDKSIPRTVAWLTDVDPFTTVSQHAKLEEAFEIASDEGYSMYFHPDAMYRKDGPLRLYGSARLDGQGSSLMALSTGPQALVAGVGLALDPGFVLKNLRLLGASTARTSDPGDNGVFLGDFGQPIVTDFTLFNVEVSSVDDPTSSTARGVGGAAFWFGNVQRGQISQCRAYRSKADGFHVVHGSKDLQFDQPFAYAVGDDSFANVSYASGGALCERIIWNSPISINGGARVCAVVGGRDIVFNDPIGLNSAAAGVYFASEDSFNTTGVDNCHVKRGTFLGACQGSAATGPNFRQAGMLVLGRTGSDTIGGEVISRAVQRSSIEATMRGDGPAMTALLDCQSEFNFHNRFDIRGYNTVAANGFAVGGLDTELRFRGENIGGLLGFVSQGTRGTLKLDVDCDGSRIAGGSGPMNVNIYLQGDTVNEVQLTGKLAGGPATLVGADNFTLSKLKWEKVSLNGAKLLDRNLDSGTVTFSGGWGSASGHPVRIERNPAGTAVLSGEFTGGTLTAGTVFGTLPAGYRPTEVTRQPVTNADGSIGSVSIGTDGVMTILAGVTGAFQINVPIQAGRA